MGGGRHSVRNQPYQRGYPFRSGGRRSAGSSLADYLEGLAQCAPYGYSRRLSASIQYDFTFSDGTDEVLRSANGDAWGHAGFGYVVSHSIQGNSPLGKVNAPTSVQPTVFFGGHHAIHRVELLYDRDKEPGGQGIKIPVVIEWLVATGRDHPLWSVTWKAGQAINPGGQDFDNYRMDSRGPYGSLNFDGAATAAQSDAVGGVAWGDFALRFTTTGEPLTLNSSWTYNTPNTVNFVRAWTFNKNAEMGIVQTRVSDKEMGYPDRVFGREWQHFRRRLSRQRGLPSLWRR